MTEREKIVEIVLDTEITGIKLRNITGGISTANAIADALIGAGYGDVKERKFEADHYWRMWQGSLVELERAEHRADIAERALRKACEHIDGVAETCAVCAKLADKLKVGEVCDRAENCVDNAINFSQDKLKRNLQRETVKRKRFSAKERQKVYDKCNGHCAYCGCVLDIKDMQIDHVQSLYWHDGSNNMDNLLPACRSCNHYKGTSTLENFRKNLEHMPQVLMRDCVTYRIATRYGLVVPNEQKVVFYFEEHAEEGKK